MQTARGAAVADDPPLRDRRGGSGHDHRRGLVFGVAPNACQSGCGALKVLAVPSEPAHSAPDVAALRCGVEICGQEDVWTHLSTPASRVSAEVGTSPGARTLTMTASDADGTLLDQTSVKPPGGAGAQTLLTVSAPGARIACVRLELAGGLVGGDAISLDDLRVETPATPPRNAVSASRHARVRVPVSDGFNQTTVRSGLLRVAKHRRHRRPKPSRT